MTRKMLTASALFALLLGSVAVAQTGPTGQNSGGAISASNFAANTQTAGFLETAFSTLVVPSTSTAQATFSNGAVATGTVITTKTTLITTCSSTTGPTLPAVNAYVPITLINRSGGSCLIWPSIGATLETADGTVAAANAPFTMLTNTDVTFRPVSATAWDQ
jgi:hypothetical protein